MRVAERAYARWAVPAVVLGVLAPEDVLVGAFKPYVATGVLEPRASIYNTPQGLGIAVPALVEALRWRYSGETSACRYWRLHWSEGATLPLLHALFAPVWHGGMVQEGCTHMPGWDEAPLRRLILVEGYVAGFVWAGPGHMVGLNCRGHTFCCKMGDALQDRDTYAATAIVLGRLGRVWQVVFIVLPGKHVVGTRPRLLGAAGFPSWRHPH